ncbi:DoxX-like family protein, partial [Pseudoduganella sp. RAF53_2]
SATGPDGAARVARLLGRSPRGIESFIAQGEAELLRHRALADWRTRALQFALALVWIATAVISAFVYPVSGSLEILARVGLHGSVAPVALYGASLLHFALGIATLAWPRRALWAVQAALILGYSIVITAAMPEYWAHPFGPVLKNLPILAILAVLYAEPTSWNT